MTDRMIAIGTTRLDVDLSSLYVSKLVQDVVNENLSTTRDRASGDKGLRGNKTSAAPTEMWTATVTPIRYVGW